MSRISGIIKHGARSMGQEEMPEIGR